MKDPHAKYTYEYELVRCTGRGVEEIPGYLPTHVAIYRRPVKPNADGYQYAQWLLDIPLPELQVQTAMQPPQNCAALCERLRQLSEDMHRVSADLRYYAGFNTDQSEWGKQLWSFADLPKTWANKIETRGAK